MCILKDRCKLTDNDLTTCPIFENNPPREAPDYEQQQLPWDAVEGAEGGGGL